MKARQVVLTLAAVCGLTVAMVVSYMATNDIAVLSPEGVIGRDQRNLIVFASILMAAVVLPVFGMLFFIAWKYRATNKKATYQPDWDHNRAVEALWWGIPLALIAVLAVVTWFSSHRLDPYRPIASSEPPLTIQVVALQWRWLFIYPEQGIASLNTVALPEDRPVQFVITSDAPMNSFWIPKLGGQVYAMSGMSTQLHLVADNQGDYEGVSANISGEGFSDMRFAVQVLNEQNFVSWVTSAQSIDTALDMSTYATLARPTRDRSEQYYGKVAGNLYDSILMKYMSPGAHGG